MPTNNLKLNPKINSVAHSQSSSQGIWSTMKNLMNQGHHLSSTHSHGHSLNHQMSHAHVYTLAGNPPNVVDLTSEASSTSNKVGSNNKLGSTISEKARSKSKQRPWSKQSRAIRNATISDITAQGMIRSSASSGTNAIAVGIDGGIAMAAADTTLNPTLNNNTTNNTGFKRLWRGVQTMFVGCIPAHALYFSSYEMIKSICTDGHTPTNDDKGHHVGHDTLSATQAMVAGGVATLLHDVVMTPMDTMKQRMQLGHYDNLRHAFVSIVQGDGETPAAVAAGEGWRGLYRSLPITVMTNVPYGMIMMTTNEWLRGVLEDGLYGIHPQNEAAVDENPFHFATILLSGMGAGTIASAATAPLDRVKTRLQTQRMGMVVPGMSNNSAVMEERALAKAQGKPQVCPKMAVQDVKRTLGFQSPSIAAPSSISSTSTMTSTIQKTPFNKTYYTTPLEAFQSIIQEEGIRGLFRGTLPRVALHAPSVAISWTAYEMAKDWLVWSQHH